MANPNQHHNGPNFTADFEDTRIRIRSNGNSITLDEEEVRFMVEVYDYRQPRTRFFYTNHASRRGTIREITKSRRMSNYCIEITTHQPQDQHGRITLRMTSRQLGAFTAFLNNFIYQNNMWGGDGPQQNYELLDIEDDDEYA